MLVRQVQHAIRILEYFAGRHHPATPAEIADFFGWPRSSTLNLVETLAAAGLLYEPKFRTGYYPTTRLLTLAQDIVANGPITDQLIACVTHVAEKTSETAALCALSGTETVFVEVRESCSPIRYFAHVGQRVATHATSAGRALLSMVSAKERSAILKRCEFVPFAADSLMTPEAVEADIQASMARGWFLNDNGFEPDLIGVAIPMPVQNRLFCLMVACPAYRGRQRIQEFADILCAEVRAYAAPAPSR